LREISAVEGDDYTINNPNEKLRGLNFNRSDRGEEDGITFILSIASIIKTINETPSHIIDAIANEFPLLPPPAAVPGNYSIPDQDTVDMIVDGVSEEEKKSLVADTDGDGIYDAAGIVLGIRRGIEPSVMVKRVDQVINDRAKSLNNERKYTNMVNTGPYTVIEKMQGRTVFEFMKILPFLILFLIAVLFFFHRSIKVAIIALIPVMLALMMTLGIMGILSNVFPDKVIISPQVSLLIPIMLALGVAYGLYIANRFAEEKSGTPKQRMLTTIKAMNNAILLSAFTTSIGFGSLMIGTLPPIVAIGLALAVGIMLTYLITMIVTPSLVMLLGYEKKKEFAAWGKFASVPSKNRKKLIAIALLLTVISALTIPRVKFDADYLAMMPADDPAILAMDEYSKEMGGGMIGMIIVRANVSKYDTLSITELIEEDINDVQNSKALSIVDIMKMVKTPDNVTITTPIQQEIEMPGNVSYWSLVERQDVQIPLHGSSREMWINIFYDALGPELKWMFINPSYSKMLLYVFMPYMDVEESRKAVTAVDKAVDTKGYLPGGTISHLTGVAPLILAINDLIIVSQFQTLALCIFLSFVVLTAVFRSWKMGLLTIIPCVLVVSYEPMTMVGLNIPLSIITVMIGSIAIGTGVDFSIQISQRIRLMGMGLAQIRNAVEHMGISFVEATATMVIGFSAVLVAPWPGPGPMGLPFTLGVGIQSVREFVIMIMILLTFNMICALLILPALYTLWIRFKRREELRLKEVEERAKELEKEEPVPADLVEEVDIEGTY
jgi:predicted RND superfamily exporter protein